jgi:hypothetical protein
MSGAILYLLSPIRPHGVVRSYKEEARGHLIDLREMGAKLWTGCIWLREGPMAGCCEHGHEPSGSIKGGQVFN